MGIVAACGVMRIKLYFHLQKIYISSSEKDPAVRFANDRHACTLSSIVSWRNLLVGKLHQISGGDNC